LILGLKSFSVSWQSETIETWPKLLAISLPYFLSLLTKSMAVQMCILNDEMVVEFDIAYP